MLRTLPHVMEQWIIDKFDLIQTDKQVGKSFVYGVIIYRVAILPGVYIFRGDPHTGEVGHIDDHQFISFINENTNRYGKVTPEFLQSIRYKELFYKLISKA